MQIYPEKLQAALSAKLESSYLIAGDDVLLHQEACDKVRKAAQKKGFKQHNKWVVEPGFDWGQWLDSCQAMSLFADKQFIELTIPNGKPGTQGANTITHYLTQTNPDVVLLVQCPKLDKSNNQSRWVKSLKQNGVFVPIYPLAHHRIPAWLQQRAKQYQLKLSHEACELLSERVQGNLLAAKQELEKLSLLLPQNSSVDIKTVAAAVADSARYNAYDILDSALHGDTRSVIRGLHYIKQDKQELPLLLWAIARELRLLLTLQKPKANTDIIFREQRTLPKRQKLLLQYAKRQNKENIEQHLSLLNIIDMRSKGADGIPPWDTLETLLLALSEPNNVSILRELQEQTVAQ